MSNFRERWENPVFKVLLISLLLWLLWLPTALIKSLVGQRSQLRAAAVEDIVSRWGGAEMLSGPFVVARAEKKSGTMDTGWSTSAPGIREGVKLMPEVLEIKSALEPEVRSRGIHRVALYKGAINLAARFDLSMLQEAGYVLEGPGEENVTVLLGFTNLKGLSTGNVTLKVNGAEAQVEVLKAADASDMPFEALLADITVLPETQYLDIEAGFSINGSGSLMFVPLGRETSVEMATGWNSPGFQGAFLPETHDITDEGFSARWRVSGINSAARGVWEDGWPDFRHSAFGVDLVFPLEGYQKTERTIKYSPVLIGLAFLSFVLVEVLSGRLIHPVQYLLVGLSLVVFYVLLLSLSEQMGFAWAYVTASVALIALTGTYLRAILKSTELGLAAAGLLSAFYAVMFVVLHSEDYALLSGSLFMLFILSGTMYATRNVDWFALGKKQ